MKHLYWIPVLCLAIAGCKGSALQKTVLDVVIPQDLDAPDPDQAEGDLGLEVEGPDGGLDVAPDLLVDAVTSCEEGDGCFGDPCAENEECASGWCVKHLGDGVCTETCQEDCPEGWSCQQLAGADPDVVYICVSDYPSLCMPCAVGSDCAGLGGSAAPCVDFGVGMGSFCGGACGGGGECPEGFLCQQATTVDGATLAQCLPAEGLCECSKTSIALGLSTPCDIENEEGTCAGVMVCTAGGLSDCDATTAAAEVCDGADNDCDGDVDEETCDDGNACTEDTCLGPAGCEFVALDGVECLDGDLCTHGDHCEAGTCVGSGVLCDDGEICTDDTCDPETGDCLFVHNVDPCDDGDPCTVADLCQEGACVGVPVDCDCQTDEDCGKLEDGDLCNGTLVCNLDAFPHQCDTDPATVIECDDPEGADAPCLEAACDPETGACGFAEANEGFPCQNDDLCTVGDLCEKGECLGGVPANCNDGDVCTDDVCEPSVGCQNVPNDAPCDDGDLCTLDDYCEAGLCQHGPEKDCVDGNPCTDDSCDPGSGCAYLPNQAPCDDLNACTEDGLCTGGTCVPGKAVDCDDGSVCTDDSCDPLSGCQYTFNAAPCADGNPCTTEDTCVQGLCLGQPADCDDGNLCTDDACDPDSGCVNTPNTAPCNDGNACTMNETCGGGTCAPGAPVVCNDGNPCTDDACDPLDGCGSTPNSAACDDGDLCTEADLCADGICAGLVEKDCDDGNPCTDDVCYSSEGCVHTPSAGLCDDGNPCTVGDACSGGICMGLVEQDCDDGNPCTTDTCTPASGCLSTPNVLPCNDGNFCTVGDVCDGGVCQGAPIDCDDANPCTDDLCHPSDGCQAIPNLDPCDDLNTCTTDDSCVGGVCVGIGSLDCDDGNPCTKDICEPGGGCAHADVDGACDDGDDCTVNDSCVDGMCNPGAPMNCDDGNPCTADSCADGTCAYADVPGSCDDGNVCTTGDHCVDGACEFTGTVVCDDDNPCTADWCNHLQGCEYVDTAVPCNDGNACTAGEVCADGACQGGAAMVCDDGNPCTDDSCDPAMGCIDTPNTASCDDGNACTAGDACSGGACVGAVAVDCDDGELCTTDSCHPLTGCGQVDNTNPCDDGDLCTTGDLCGGGACQPGGAMDCDDSNPCTDDSCAPAVGCLHVPGAGACEDGNVCTTGDSCVAGVCFPGSAVVCDDGNPCTDDLCHPQDGCQYAANIAACSDDDLCTDGDLCANEACVPGAPLDCDDGDACTADSCDPATGCVHVLSLPDLTGTCAEVLAICPGLPTGTYELDLDDGGPLPAMEIYCDMDNAGGGWTGFTSQQAHDLLGGVMACPDGAATEGIDSLGRPYTRDQAGSHTCHYTFDLPFIYSEFFLAEYKAKANAGPGYTSELNIDDFWQQTSWQVAHGTNYYGDIGFGTAAESGPVVTYSGTLPYQVMCTNCEIPWPAGDDIYELGQAASTFRMGWGEYGGQHEGWYPWWSGWVMVR